MNTPCLRTATTECLTSYRLITNCTITLVTSICHPHINMTPHLLPSLSFMQRYQHLTVDKYLQPISDWIPTKFQLLVGEIFNHITDNCVPLFGGHVRHKIHFLILTFSIFLFSVSSI
eukprot:Lithocolla_globosa_v1_NODE_7474_length_942_cov_9.599775.p2 type:complete len:117 gc:universal NODE_7474_length_942_cov_9.599775:855-505(-)